MDLAAWRDLSLIWLSFLSFILGIVPAVLSMVVGATIGLAGETPEGAGGADYSVEVRA